MRSLYLFLMTILICNVSQTQWIKTSGNEGGLGLCIASHDGILFVGGSFGVYKSIDSATSWTAVNNGLPSGPYGIINSVTALYAFGGSVFAGTGSPYIVPSVYRSTDDGNSWSTTSTGIPSDGVHCFTSIGGTLFVGTFNNGVYLSTDNGDTWTGANSGLTNTTVWNLAVSGVNLYAGTEGGVFLSTDNGNTWNAVNNGLTTLSIRSILPVGGTLYCAGFPGKSFLSNNGGAIWTEISSGLPYTVDFSLGTSNGNLLAGTEFYGIYRSTDNGNNWFASNAGHIYKPNVHGLLVADGYVFVVGEGGIYASSDDGANWHVRNSGLEETDNKAMIVKDSSIFAGTFGDGIYRSRDNGAHWIPVNTGLGDYRIDALVAVGDTLIAGSNDSYVFRSTNDGASWSNISGGITDPRVFALTRSGSNIFAATSVAGVFLSTDYGTSWSAVNTGLTIHNTLSLAVRNDSIYVGTENGGLFLSTNNGAVWNSIDVGLPNDGITAIGVVGNNLYAGCAFQGIYLSTNGGATWSVTNSNSGALVSIFLNERNAALAGVYGRSVIFSLDRGSTWLDADDYHNATDEGLGWDNSTALAIADSFLVTGLGNYGYPTGLGYGGIWRRPLSEILPYGSVSGVVFNDINGNGHMDVGDTGMIGWKVYLRSPSGSVIDSTTTVFGGAYLFQISSAGSYVVSEYADTGWVQTYPSGSGSYTISIVKNSFLLGEDFGNVHGYKYIGPPSGVWSNPANWTGGHAPDSTNPAIIPPNVTVTVDSLPNDSIRALKIEAGAILAFSTSVGSLKVGGKVYIDSGGVVTFTSGGFNIRQGQTNNNNGLVSLHPQLDANPSNIICYYDWVNFGTMNAGSSKITFSGSRLKTISGGSQNNIFYQLEINGDSTNVSGAIVAENQLLVHKNLYLGINDTAIIENNNVGAIQDTGEIPSGTVKRKILQGETNPYRFESPSTRVSFNGTGSYPSYVAMTTLPDTTPPNFNLRWQVVPSHVDTLANIITADSVNHFSRWAIAVPRPTGQVSVGVSREYGVEVDGGTGFLAQLQLRYDQTEVPQLLNETTLKLLRGPFIDDSVNAGWNMVSLSLLTDSTARNYIFPGAESDAFTYNGSYQISNNLVVGEGYWLRFPTSQLVSVKGNDLAVDTLPVSVGWNMIGTVSYPVPVLNISTNPPGTIASSYFGYTNGYLHADTLWPMHSYWVKASVDGTIILRSTAGGVLSEQKMYSFETLSDKFNSLDITDAEGNRGRLYFGRQQTNLDVRLFELPPLPPEGAFDVRYATGRTLAVNNSSRGEDIPIWISAVHYPLTLGWECKQAQEGNTLFIGSEKEVELSGNGSLTISSPVNAIRIHLAPASGVDGLPKEYALDQAYPNPFNPSTTIRYSLPVNSWVRLKVYNVLGQIVATLQEGMEEAGYKQVQWNASGFANGIYFYRLEAISTSGSDKAFTQVRKVVLVK